MSFRSSLYVPIDVEAFCVGVTDVNGSSGYGTQDFARISNDFSLLPYTENGRAYNDGRPALGALVYPGYFQSNPVGEAPQTGIHLHWALPDALAHGEPDEDGNIAFRDAPNRWLVVRVIEGVDAGQPDLDAWVVASDELWDHDGEAPDAQNAPSLTTPVSLGDGVAGKVYRRIGRVYPYTDWTEPGSADMAPNLSAVGYGEPTYAAGYVHSQNVFGFYDPLADHRSDADTADPSWRVAYFVAGWYATPDNDPIARLKLDATASYADKLARLEEVYKWAFAPADDAAFPSRTFCHGLIYNIEWKPGRAYVKSRPQGDVTVAVGNTTSEALAALIADQAAGIDPGHLETTLTILQQGLLARLDQPGGLAAAEEKMHENGFSRSPAGPLWLVKRKSADAATTNPSPDQGDIARGLLRAAGDQATALPDEVAILLDALNQQQLGVDRLLREITTRRGQLFVDWYKYMILEHPPQDGTPPPNGVDVNMAFDFISGEARDIAGNNYDGQGGQLARLTKLTDGVTQLKGLITKRIAGLDLELVEVEAPRYWQPHDPVVLISGTGLEAPDRHGRDGRFDEEGRLICRVSGQLVTKMFIADGAIHAQVGTTQLPVLTGPATPPDYADDLGDLLDEALFLLPQDGQLLAKAANDVTLAQAIATAQANLLTGKRDQNKVVTFNGLRPSPLGHHDWGGSTGENPWLPLMMQWKVDFAPTLPITQDPNSSSGSDTAYPRDFIGENFTFDDAALAIDLVPCAAPGAWTSRQTYNGGIVLAADTEINLAHQAKQFLNNYPDSPHAKDLTDILAWLKKNRLCHRSQALSGFNEALMMRELGLQMPVYDPLNTKGLHNYMVNEVLPDIVGKQNVDAPLPLNYFNPIRAGHAKISRIRVVDAFGQYQDITPVRTIVSASLRPAVKTDDNLFFLPPRITQPARLQFRWQAAVDDSMESNSHPVSSPIFGWVLFNHLDDSLAVYDGAGNALGSFNILGPAWEGAPGAGGTYGTINPQDVLDTLTDTPGNKHLANFVTGVYGALSGDDQRNYLKALLAAIDRSVTTIDPSRAKQHQGLSVLIGRPLALTRASLQLELDGLPVLDQSWPAFNRTIDTGGAPLTYADREQARFTDVVFPVQLGDLSKVNDGLIGYFMTGPGDSTPDVYRKFYAPAAEHTRSSGQSDGAEQGVFPPAFDQIQLKPSYGVNSEVATAHGITYERVTGQTAGESQFVTMLVDPRAAVHATTGILPTKGIEIPPDFYADALARMAITFQTAPLLTSAHQLSVPLPKEEGFAWSWVTVADGKWSERDDISPVNPHAVFSYPPVVAEEGWLRLRVRNEENSKI